MYMSMQKHKFCFTAGYVKKNIIIFFNITLKLCVISEVQVWERRNNTFVISPGVVRCTVRRLTSELTCAGTQARDPSFARGVTAARDSPAATNSSVTAEHTQVWAQGLCWIWNYIIQLLLYIFCLLLQVNRWSSSSRG